MANKIMNRDELDAQQQILQDDVLECESQLRKAEKRLENFIKKRRESCSHVFKVACFIRSERTIYKCECCGEEK